MTKSIRHITLNTGHSRDILPGEVEDAAMRALAPMLKHLERSAAAGAPIAVPGVAGYSVTGRTDGDCLVATVWHDGPPSVMVASLAVSLARSCGGPTLWEAMHRWGDTPVVTDPADCPAEPWLAVAVELGALGHPDCLHWLGDFERCLAWAWWLRRAASGEVAGPDVCH